MEWSKKPIHTLVYSIVRSKRNILFEDLMKSVKNIISDVSESEVRKALLKLEIWGKLSVETEGTSSRIVYRGGE